MMDGFVWRQPDLLQLLDSVLQGFPIGSILIWDTEQKVESTERVGPVTISPPSGGVTGYLLDGQQRVSTLVGTLRLPDGVPSVMDDVDWAVYCDLDTREFVRAPSGGVEPRHFPVRSLVNTAGFIAACRRIQTEVTNATLAQRWIDEADQLANAFRDYQLPVIRIREATLDSAVTVFARLNRTGRKMTADQMVSALTYQEGQFNLAEKIDEFEEELEGRGFGNLDRVFLLRAIILAALDRDIYGKDWADLMVKPEVRERLPSVFLSAKAGIKSALDFLRDLGVTSDRLLPYGLQIVFLGEFFRLCPKPEKAVAALLERWFWVTSFTGWFGGVNSAQATHALGEIRDLARNNKAKDFRVVDLNAPAQAFPERFDGRSARVRAFLLYLASLRPRSLYNTGALDPGRLLSSRGTKAVGYVLSNLEPSELVSSPANRMFVDDDHVGQAFSRLGALSDPEVSELLLTHGFPPDSVRLLRDGQRTALIKARLEHLIADEREFMRVRHVHLPPVKTAINIADSETSDEE